MSNDAYLYVGGEEHMIKLGEDRVKVYDNEVTIGKDNSLFPCDKDLIKIIHSDGVTIDLSNHPYKRVHVAFSTAVTIIISDTPYEKITIETSDVEIITKERNKFE